MANELNLDSLIAELGDNITSTDLGSYNIKELKMNEQRKIMNMSFKAIEIPARVSNIFNDFIKSSVTITDETVADVLSKITVDVKPFLLAQIRILTLGDAYVDKRKKKTYTINPITEEDLISTVKPKTIQHNNISITVAVPNLLLDQTINNQLLLELGKFKKDISEEEYGKVADTYQMYEIFKYITEIKMGDNSFDFVNCPINKKMKIVNNLSPRVIGTINAYIEKAKHAGENDIIATHTTSGETIKLDVSTIFFENTAKLSDNE
jgi:hypothetical protein